MDDSQKIHLLKSSRDDKFIIVRTIDFAHHSLLHDIEALRNNDWVRLHMMDRTLTFGNRTYNFVTNQSIEVTVPNNYFGQEIDDLGDRHDKIDSWKILNIQSMPTTTSVIAQC